MVLYEEGRGGVLEKKRNESQSQQFRIHVFESKRSERKSEVEGSRGGKCTCTLVIGVNCLK